MVERDGGLMKAQYSNPTICKGEMGDSVLQAFNFTIDGFVVVYYARRNSKEGVACTVSILEEESTHYGADDN